MSYLLLFLCTRVFAISQIDDLWAARLTQAVNIGEVEEIERSFTQLRVLKRACEIEKVEIRVPHSCYELDALAATLNVSIEDQGADAICKQAVKSYQDTKLPQDRRLSSRCRQWLDDRVQLNRYRQGLE